MWLLPRLCLLLAATVTPCLSKITELSLRVDNRASIPLAHPFAFVTSAGDDVDLQRKVIELRVSDAKVIWKLSSTKNLECLNVFLVTEEAYLRRLDTQAVESLCKRDVRAREHLPDWASHFTSFADHEFDLYEFSEFKEVKVVGFGDGAWYTPYLVNCCPHEAAVSLHSELQMYNAADGQRNYLSVGELPQLRLSLVRFPHSVTDAWTELCTEWNPYFGLMDCSIKAPRMLLNTITQ